MLCWNTGIWKCVTLAPSLSFEYIYISLSLKQLVWSKFWIKFLSFFVHFKLSTRFSFLFIYLTGLFLFLSSCPRIVFKTVWVRIMIGWTTRIWPLLFYNWNSCELDNVNLKQNYLIWNLLSRWFAAKFFF